MPKKRNPRRQAETIRFSPEENPDFQHPARRFGSLLVVQGAEIDLGTHVICDRPVTLGRDIDVEMPLRDGSISRRHCRVERDEETGSYYVSDLGSTNGTRLNGQVIDGRLALAEGDKIFLGATVVKFGYSDKFDVEYYSKLERWVRTDSLTGLLTKRQFDAAFAHAVQRSRSDGHPLSVLVMDMDGLKQINDTHGHEMGGFAIVEVARIIQLVVDQRGQTCRFGGDEFITYLPDTSKEVACHVAEQIRDGVASHNFEKNDIVVAPTISIGVASFPVDGDSPEELFRVADRALYRAKGAGKNQVAV